mmetsp:Transcript_12068/g.21807  ORF Transcript_12068/g.21807 Transcript_12068/m.21807 type:complete len:273 (-) Transcript_12068:145-963(-)
MWEPVQILDPSTCTGCWRWEASSLVRSRLAVVSSCAELCGNRRCSFSLRSWHRSSLPVLWSRLLQLSILHRHRQSVRRPCSRRRLQQAAPRLLQTVLRLKTVMECQRISASSPWACQVCLSLLPFSRPHGRRSAAGSTQRPSSGQLLQGSLADLETQVCQHFPLIFGSSMSFRGALGAGLRRQAPLRCDPSMRRCSPRPQPRARQAPTPKTRPRTGCPLVPRPLRQRQHRVQAKILMQLRGRCQTLVLDLVLHTTSRPTSFLRCGGTDCATP